MLQKVHRVEEREEQEEVQVRQGQQEQEQASERRRRHGHVLIGACVGQCSRDAFDLFAPEPSERDLCFRRRRLRCLCVRNFNLYYTCRSSLAALNAWRPVHTTARGYYYFRNRITFSETRLLSGTLTLQLDQISLKWRFLSRNARTKSEGKKTSLDAS